MRVFAQCVAICCLVTFSSPAVSITAQSPQPPPKKDAATILAQAREALGGEKRLSAVKNFVATGRTRQVRGDNLVPIEFEIAVELPDKYVRKDEIPAQESGPTSTGFNVTELIQLPVPVQPVAPQPQRGEGGPPQRGQGAAPAQRGEGAAPPQRGEGAPPQRGEGAPPPQRGGTEPAPPKPQGAEGGRGEGGRGEGGPGRAAGPGASPTAQMEAMRNARVATVKQDFVRLTLGMFASSFSSYPLTFTYAGQAEAPQGTADMLDVKGPANFSARLFINSQTHLPIMISWQAPAGRGRGPGPGGPPGAAPGGPPGGAPAGRGAAPAAPPATTPPATTPPATAPPATAPPATAPAAPPGAAPAGPPGAAAGAPPGAARGAGPGGAPPSAAAVENRLYFADYRDVDGMQWPFRLRRATGADTTEETTFDRFKVNTKIDPKKFEVRK